jgi:putative nucleotidyltransferase with HDIG domain
MFHARDSRTGPLLAKLLRRKGPEELLNELCEHDPDTYAHSLRVAALSIDLAFENRLPLRIVAQIGTAALVHDVGKRHIRREILQKRGRLGAEELTAMRQHARIGFVELKRKVPDRVRRIAVAHHEFTPAGYPRNRANVRARRAGHGERRSGNVGEWAEIIAAADMFDALVSPRAYKTRFDRETVETKLAAEFTGSRHIIPQLLSRYPQR